MCTTAHTSCCTEGHDTQGRFFYPDGSPVQTQSQASSSSQSFYVTQNQGSISLIRQDGDPPPLGSYRCEVPDGAGSLQNLYIRIGETVLSMTLCVYVLILLCICVCVHIIVYFSDLYQEYNTPAYTYNNIFFLGTITRDALISSPTSTGASCVNLYVFIGVVVGVAVLAVIVIILISVCLCVTCTKKKKVTVELYEQETKIKPAAMKMDEL